MPVSTIVRPARTRSPRGGAAPISTALVYDELAAAGCRLNTMDPVVAEPCASGELLSSERRRRHFPGSDADRLLRPASSCSACCRPTSALLFAARLANGVVRRSRPGSATRHSRRRLQPRAGAGRQLGAGRSFELHRRVSLRNSVPSGAVFPASPPPPRSWPSPSISSRRRPIPTCSRPSSSPPPRRRLDRQFRRPHNPQTGQVRRPRSPATLYPDKDHELWAIEGDKAPMSMMGVPVSARSDMRPSRRFCRFRSGHRARHHARAGRRPRTGAPQGPIVAKGLRHPVWIFAERPPFLRHPLRHMVVSERHDSCVGPAAWGLGDRRPDTTLPVLPCENGSFTHPVGN